jgi:protoheme ferro-lyase
MNYYVVWQGANDNFGAGPGNGTVQFMSLKSDLGWQGPQTVNAFAGIDPDSDISCITPTGFPAEELQTLYDLSRCYFQINGAIKEILYDGSSWSLQPDPVT